MGAICTSPHFRYLLVFKCINFFVTVSPSVVWTALKNSTVLSGLYDHGVIARSTHFNWSGDGLITQGGVLRRQHH
jgi:hypothetical protein